MTAQETPRPTPTGTGGNHRLIVTNVRHKCTTRAGPHLDDAEWPFFNSIVREFEFSEWSEHNLEIAVLLAKAMSQLEVEQRHLGAEGWVIVAKNGNPRANPRGRVVATLVNRVLALRRTLGLPAPAQGHSRDEAQRRLKPCDDD